MNRRRVILIVVVMVTIVTLLLLNIKINDKLSVFQFLKGSLQIEVMNKDFVTIDEKTYLYKKQSINSLIEKLERDGYQFIEQIGSGYQFKYNDATYTYSEESVTKSYSILYTN